LPLLKFQPSYNVVLLAESFSFSCTGMTWEGLSDYSECGAMLYAD